MHAASWTGAGFVLPATWQSPFVGRRKIARTATQAAPPADAIRAIITAVADGPSARACARAPPPASVPAGDPRATAAAAGVRGGGGDP